MKEGRFRLDVRGKFFAGRVVGCWGGLSGGVVGAPSLEVFGAGLGGALGGLVWCWVWRLVALPGGGVGASWSLRSLPALAIL